MANTYYIDLNPEKTVLVQLNRWYYRPGKYDGPYESSYPSESEIEWDVIDDEGAVDSVSYDELSEAERDTIEEYLWDAIEKEERYECDDGE
jgi:hypothetical protein